MSFRDSKASGSALGALALFSLILLGVSAAQGQPLFYGDLDESGGASAADVVTLVNHLNGAPPLPPERVDFADANQDSFVNQGDVDFLVGALLGTESLSIAPEGVEAVLVGEHVGTLVREEGGTLPGVGGFSGALTLLLQIEGPGDTPTARLISESQVGADDRNNNPMYFPPGEYTSPVFLQESDSDLRMVFSYVTPAEETAFGRELARSMEIKLLFEEGSSRELAGTYAETIAGVFGPGTQLDLQGDVTLLINPTGGGGQ